MSLAVYSAVSGFVIYYTYSFSALSLSPFDGRGTLLTFSNVLCL